MPSRDEGGQPREGVSHKPRRKASEKSDAPIVPKKSMNARVTPEESMEGRGAANRKLVERNARRTLEERGALKPPQPHSNGVAWSFWAEQLQSQNGNE